ncbi:hypothetical protein BJV78DRAFT_1122961 [Lactifluus subvellereus]|nr:hypothetical protein BJV78DRAFT_1122961 [Lactifluus subvellereus]
MANLIRSAKSGSDWTANDLLAYNIQISPLTPDEFYGTPLPTVASLSSLDPQLLSGTLNTAGLSDETYRLLQYLDLASRANAGQESAIDDFAREILRAVGYERRGLLLRSRYAIPLLICGDPNRSAQTDVTLIQGSSTVLLVVQEDKTAISTYDPEPQVIAEAIATFQYNNRTRARLGQPVLASMTIPCITMIGTRPIFYLVPVTRELSEAVATAQYPHSPTLVKKCVAALHSRRLSEGMESPDFRQLALRHYTAFRTLAEAHWSAFMIPVEGGN